MDELDNLIIKYKETGCVQVFEQIYQIVRGETVEISRGKLYFERTAKSMNADSHDVAAVFDDTLLNALRLYKPGNDFIRYFKSSWRRRRTNLFESTQHVRKNELQWVYEEDGKDGNFALDFPSPFNLEEAVTAKKKADQLALIDSLLVGADATTIGVVEAFLNHPKPTATAIAKELGVHHSKVIRALNRLAGKFSTKQHGDFRDYLVAL